LTKSDKPQPRDRNWPICVYVNGAERTAIRERARVAGLRVSHFGRAAMLGVPIRSVLDLQAVAELARISSELGGLHELLKLNLNSPEANRQVTENLLSGISAAIAELRKTASTIRTTQ
jgi:hypothetical protein